MNVWLTKGEENPTLTLTLSLRERAANVYSILLEGHENQRDRNVPPILVDMDRRGFLTPPEGFTCEI